MNSMIGRELAEIDGDGDSHVLKPSELTKGRKRKNIPTTTTREETNDSVDGDDEFTQLQPKPGAHMVLPFIPPKVDSSNVFRKKNTFIAQLTCGLFFLLLSVPNHEERGRQLDQAQRVSEKPHKPRHIPSKVQLFPFRHLSILEKYGIPCDIIQIYYLSVICRPRL